MAITSEWLWIKNDDISCDDCIKWLDNIPCIWSYDDLCKLVCDTSEGVCQIIKKLLKKS